eukprot:gene50916-50328_t
MLSLLPAAALAAAVYRPCCFCSETQGCPGTAGSTCDAEKDCIPYDPSNVCTLSAAQCTANCGSSDTCNATEGWACCGGGQCIGKCARQFVCIKPAAEACVYNQCNGTFQTCPKATPKLCGSQCYDPAQHTCCENNLGGPCTTHDARLIAKGGTETCCVGQTSGVQVCDSKKDQKCCKNSDWEAVCCGKGQACGGTGHVSHCIDPPQTPPPATPAPPTPVPADVPSTPACSGACKVNTYCTGECSICSPKPGSTSYWCTARCGGKCTSDASCG